MRVDPFRVAADEAPPGLRVALTLASPVLSWLLQLPLYRQLYAHARTLDAQSFDQRALATLNIRTIVSGGERIPAAGPLIIAANHPHGILDGLLLSASVRRVRPDIRILTNHLLARIPELAETCFFVDPFSGPRASARSLAGLRAAHVWLRRGGALIVFPAGEVAHVRRTNQHRQPAPERVDDPGRPMLVRTYADSEWKPIVGRMALASGAQMLPAFIDGANSRLFYAAGRVHPSLRTLLLARELLKKRDQSFTIRFGASCTPRAAAVDASNQMPAAERSAARLTGVIRGAVDALAVPTPAPQPVFTRADAVAAEIARLPRELCLVESGAFQVFAADARQIPCTLREIGRLREVTYRAIGEGTGRALDLDIFDERYLHLFSWDRERRQIAGAYRIGQTDRIAAERGVDGLYTRTLFKYDERLIARLSPALELGRSFVTADYQRNYNALLLLWKGIGQFVVRNPRYRVLFGPVSISTRYSDSSHHLLMSFLLQNHRDASLAELVEAINPKTINPAPPPLVVPPSLEEANRLITQIESDGKGVPVLLRQYLKLNARLIGFNVDPHFGDALDALMMVDLATVDATILTRYLGRDGAAAFLSQHASQSADAA